LSLNVQHSGLACLVTEDIFKQIQILQEMAIEEVLGDDPFACVLAEALGVFLIFQQAYHGLAEATQVLGIIDEQAVDIVFDLIAD